MSMGSNFQAHLIKIPYLLHALEDVCFQRSCRKIISHCHSVRQFWKQDAVVL